ncbi:MAG: UDP-N-acetylenolpyruvoylglucosamine reductase, partial [bacterium]
AEIERRCKQFLEWHVSALPSEPSAGCIFRNPQAGCPAGELIEELGLKGTRSGGAVVSERHANVIVNKSGATTRDVLSLMELIRKRARENRGVDLESEVVIVGEDGG